MSLFSWGHEQFLEPAERRRHERAAFERAGTKGGDGLLCVLGGNRSRWLLIRCRDSAQIAGMETTTLGDQIRSLRQEKGISLRELARRAEISPSFLSEIENGKNFPSSETLKTIASRLKVSVASLRELDVRSQMTGLKRLIEKDPTWGRALRNLAMAGYKGAISPQQLLDFIDSK